MNAALSTSSRYTFSCFVSLAICVAQLLLAGAGRPPAPTLTAPATLGNAPPGWPHPGDTARRGVRAVPWPCGRISRAVTLAYFGFCLLMPWWSRMGAFKPVPERITFAAH